MRPYCCLLPLLLASSPALAQQSLVPAATPVSVLAPAPDTVAALHRLYAHKRQARTRTLLLTLMGGGIGTAASLDSGPLPPETNAALGASETLLALLVEYLCYQRYDQRHEQQAIWQFQTSHRLPPAIQKKLRPAYLAPPSPTDLSPR